MQEICDCKLSCFTFTKFTQDQKYISYRCGSYIPECKKKTCNYKKDVLICSITFPKNIKNKDDIIVHSKKDDFEVLNNYIHLYEITYGKNLKIGNIIANINFILSKLNYKPFLTERENIQQLKQRITRPPDNIVIKKKSKPMILIEVPENLKTVTKKCNKAKKKEQVYTLSTFYNKSKSKKIQDDDSDDDSESQLDEDEGFDIENFDSDDNANDFYDGNFSD